MKLTEVNRDKVETIINRDYPLWETVYIENVKDELADAVLSHSSNYQAERQAFTFWMSGKRHYLLVEMRHLGAINRVASLVLRHDPERNEWRIVMHAYRHSMIQN
jgi:hypothetical protein